MPLVHRSTQLLLALALVIAAASCGKKREKPPEGDIAATLEGVTLEGAQFEPSMLKGKPTVLMFVSPTCPHCLDEIPAADKAAKDKGANAVAVFIAGKAATVQGVIDSTKFTGHTLIDDGSLKRRYDIRAVPYTLVLGADGVASEAFRGSQSYERLAEAIADAR